MQTGSKNIWLLFGGAAQIGSRVKYVFLPADNGDATYDSMHKGFTSCIEILANSYLYA